MKFLLIRPQERTRLFFKARKNFNFKLHLVYLRSIPNVFKSDFDMSMTIGTYVPSRHSCLLRISYKPPTETLYRVLQGLITRTKDISNHEKVE